MTYKLPPHSCFNHFIFIGTAKVEGDIKIILLVENIAITVKEYYLSHIDDIQDKKIREYLLSIKEEIKRGAYDLGK